ncbi:DUF5129 domain-containing protein [Ornithinimicrobium humiphilum]|uniref:DUF5129 domain-containing protein n=1 Tax=Ornithinimicrobium humiphilum TaxID=125288 RepID=UPI001478A0D1|nr:DUF5129 domain-containing protein [Ornithinimicrobium humiphilum]
MIGGSVGLWATSGPEHPVSQVVLDDEAGIIHEPTLLAGLEDVRFFEPTDVAVFTVRTGRSDDLALNDAVLAHARSERPEWLSPDQQKWADDLYIFGVDPEARLVGTYFGENRKIGQDAQLAVQDATKDDLRAAQWTEGAITGVEAAAARMNAPFARTAGGAVVGGAASLLTLGASGIYYGVGRRRARRSQEARAEGDRRLAAVVADYEVTELHARLIPEESRYGGLMLRRYDEYKQGFRELTDLGNEVRSLGERDYDRKETLARLTAYRDRARELDDLDDVIADTAALLNRDRAWPEAWQRQVRPVRDDLEKVRPMLESELPQGVRGRPEALALRSFASEALTRLDMLRGQLEDSTISPDDALDALRSIRDELTTLLDKLTPVVAEEMDDESEREMLEEALRRERRARRRETTIITTTHPSWVWYPVDGFSRGYREGMSKVESSRQSSSSGSSSGFSSSGGSFSGSGSSSRF